MRRPGNILKHELIGLKCEVIKALNKYLVGMKGKIVDEALQTIVLETKGKHKIIPKKGTVFQVLLNHKKVNIDGNKILARPEQRIKKRQKRW